MSFQTAPAIRCPRIRNPHSFPTPANLLNRGISWPRAHHGCILVTLIETFFLATMVVKHRRAQFALIAIIGRQLFTLPLELSALVCWLVFVWRPACFEDA